MKKMKRILIALMALVLPLSMSGCYEPDFEYETRNVGKLQAPTVDRTSSQYREKYATLGRYEETVKLDVAVCHFELETGVAPGTTPRNQTFNQIAKDVLNIELNYVVDANSANYDQKLKLYLSSGKTPDMFYTTNSSMYSELLESGALADLSDSFWYLNDELQENYLEHFPELLPTVMEDSKLYSFPTITNTYATAQRLYIRQDWLDIVGMQAPTNMEEMYAVGKAFIDNKDKIAAATGISDSRRIIPFTMNKEITWAGSYSIEGFLNCYSTSIDSYFEGEDGNLYYSNTSKEMKDALTMLRDMYSYGILDPEFISKSAEQIQANIKAGYVGMAFGEWWMPKDVLDESITNREGANWTWVNLPSAYSEEATPVVKKVNVSGYNLVSKDCKHPEAAAKLINLFYDIYYSDDAQEKYGPGVLPSNGFYYQFVPIKLWDGIASIREYQRVQAVFEELHKLNFNPKDYVDEALYAQDGLIQKVAEANVTKEDFVVSIVDGTANIINRDVINAINANSAWKTEFYKLHNREKTLHFVDGYPYFVAFKAGKKLTEMSQAERRGWGIYHEMIDATGGYAYVVELTETKKVKYDCFYGANLSAMLQYSPYITKETNAMFTKMITGKMSIDDFEKEYVQGIVEKNGGSTIMEQVNAWYKSNNVDYEDVYSLIK